MKRKSLSKKLRFEVFKRDSFTCQYCGKSSPSVILEIDHIHPVSKGGNETDILNLITSCRECNSGKGDRLIADGSARERQVFQLKEINERREQLELLLMWKEELESLSQKSFQAILNEWDKYINPWIISEQEKKILNKLTNKHGVEKLFNAIRSSCDAYLKYDGEGKVLRESVELAFTKITLFLKLQTLPNQLRDFYYIRGILKNRLPFINWSLSLELMQEAYSAGISIDAMKHLALTVQEWWEFSGTMMNWIDDANSKNRTNTQ